MRPMCCRWFWRLGSDQQKLESAARASVFLCCHMLKVLMKWRLYWKEVGVCFRLSVFVYAISPSMGLLFIFRFCLQMAGASYVFCDELNDELMSSTSSLSNSEFCGLQFFGVTGVSTCLAWMISPSIFGYHQFGRTGKQLHLPLSNFAVISPPSQVTLAKVIVFGFQPKHVIHVILVFDDAIASWNSEDMRITAMFKPWLAILKGSHNPRNGGTYCWWFRNPANHLRYIKPCKEWWFLHINWLAGFLPSVRTMFVWLTTYPSSWEPILQEAVSKRQPKPHRQVQMILGRFGFSNWARWDESNF